MADRILRVILAGDVKGLKGAMGTAVSETGKAEGGFSKLKHAAGLAFLGVAGGAVAAGTAAVHMADEYETSHARLAVALKNTGSSADEYRSQIASADQAGAKFGFTQTDVEGALAVMVRGMGDGYKAVQNLGLAQDLAAAKGIPLADAAMLVTKASEGQIKPLKALGLDLPFAAAGAVKLTAAHVKLAQAQQALTGVQDKIRSGALTGAAAHAALAAASGKVYLAQLNVNKVANTGTGILDALGKKLGGSAAAQSETFAGKMRALHAQLTDVGIKVGMVIIPILIKLADLFSQYVVPAMQKLQQWIVAHWPQISAIAQQVFGQIRQVISTVVTWVQTNFPKFAAAVAVVIDAVRPHLAKLAAMFKAIAIVLGGIVFGLVKVLMVAWDWFGKTIISHLGGVFNALKQIFHGFVQVLDGVITFITAVFTGKWGKAWDGIKQIFDGIWNVFAGVVRLAMQAVEIAVTVGIIFVGKILGGLGHVISDAWSAIWGGLTGVVSGVFNGVVGVVVGGINAVIRALDGIHFSIPSWVPIVGGKSFGLNIPQIPWGAPAAPNHNIGTRNQRALGGPVSKLAPYLVGEYGPELFVPHTSGTVMANGKFGGGIVIELHVHPGFGTNPAQFGQDLANHMRRDAGKNGPLTRAIRAAVA